MDTKNTPTQNITVRKTSYAAAQNSNKNLFRIFIIVALVVVAIILGIFAARWISEAQVEKVFPTAPSALAADCGVAPTVIIPESNGVTYNSIRNGAILTVTAAPASDRFMLMGGATTSWEIDLTPVSCPEAESSDGPAGDSPDYVGDVIDGAKSVGSDVLDWTKENGPGIWDKTKEIGKKAKDSVEDWSKSSGSE